MRLVTRLLAATLITLAALAGPALGAPAGVCTVVPDPVDLAVDSSYTLTAVGGTPGEFYEVTMRQRGHMLTDERRVWLGQADPTGTVVAVVAVYDGIDGIPQSLWPGEPDLKVVRYRTGGGPGGAASTLAACSFTVIDTGT